MNLAYIFLNDLWTEIEGFDGLIATLPSLAYFIRLAFKEMELIEIRESQEGPTHEIRFNYFFSQTNLHSLTDEIHKILIIRINQNYRFLGNEPLSPEFVEFMKGENRKWKPNGDEFGTPT